PVPAPRDRGRLAPSPARSRSRPDSPSCRVSAGPGLLGLLAPRALTTRLPGRLPPHDLLLRRRRSGFLLLLRFLPLAPLAEQAGLGLGLNQVALGVERRDRVPAVEPVLLAQRAKDRGSPAEDQAQRAV